MTEMPQSLPIRNPPLHICIVCSEEFEQKVPMLQYPVGATGKDHIQPSSNLLDEFGIFFGLRCLALSESVVEDLFQQLVDLVGEPGNWGISFCPNHADILKKALEMDQLIKRLSAAVDNIQLSLIAFVKADLQKKKSMGPASGKENMAFQLIRNSIKSVLVPLPSSTKRTSKERKEKRKTREEKKVCPDVAETVLSESNEIHFKVEVDSDNVEFNENEREEDGDLLFWKDYLEEENDSSHLNQEMSDSGLKRFRKRKTRTSDSKRAPKRQTSSKLSSVVGRSFACKFCPNSTTTFPTTAERDNHVKEIHGPKPYICATCGMSYANIYSLQYHETRSHKPIDQFPCEKCPKIYKSSRDLSVHIRQKHSAQATEELNCPHCDKVFTGRYNLRAHVLDVHEKKRVQRTEIVCEICSKIFHYHQDFKRHQDKVHFSRHVGSMCELCGKVLADEKSLKKHKDSQHLKTFKFQCNICGSGSLFKSHHIAHLKKSHGIEYDSNLNTVNKKPSEKSSATSSSSNIIPHFPSQTPLSEKLSAPNPVVPSQNIQSQIQQLLKGSQSYECYQCGEEFFTSVQINYHKRHCAHVAF